MYNALPLCKSGEKKNERWKIGSEGERKKRGNVGNERQEGGNVGKGGQEEGSRGREKG